MSRYVFPSPRSVASQVALGWDGELGTFFFQAWGVFGFPGRVMLAGRRWRSFRSPEDLVRLSLIFGASLTSEVVTQLVRDCRLEGTSQMPQIAFDLRDFDQIYSRLTLQGLGRNARLSLSQEDERRLFVRSLQSGQGRITEFSPDEVRKTVQEGRLRVPL